MIPHVLDLADKAVRCVLGSNHYWEAEDWDDARQEAALQAWCATTRGTAYNDGYVFNAARKGVYTWLRMWRHSHPRGGTLLDYLGYAQIDTDPYTVGIDLDKLRILLQFQQAQKVEEDIRYLELRLAGYSTAGIALDMGLSERNVYAIRERLLPRLERIMRGEDPPDRGAAISAAKARKRLMQ